MSQNQSEILQTVRKIYKDPIWEEDNLTLVNYDLITRKKLRKLDKSDAIVFIPVALMEVHGEFLPLGTDYMESIG